MSSIIVQSTLWNELPDVHSAIEFSEKDAECLTELRQVLIKFGSLDRFGICLLHTHFEIEDDEILLETTNVEERTQFIRPVKIQDYEGKDDLKLMTTALKLIEGDAIAVQRCGCLRDKDGHTGRHDPPISY